MQQVVFKPYTLQQINRPFPNLFSQGDVLVSERRDQDIFKHGALGQEMMQLKNESDFPITDSRKFGFIESGKVPAIEQNLSCCGAVEGANDIKQRALAAAGRSNYYDGLAVRDP
jgi:hypothetical protein